MIKKWFQTAQLTPKIAAIVGSCLTLILAVLVTIIAFLAKSSMENAIIGELHALSSGNAHQVQAILDSAASVGNDMESYMQTMLGRMEKNPEIMVIPTEPELAAMYKSEITGDTLCPGYYRIESFLMESARNAAVNNDNIFGVGVFFNQYAFQNDIRDYAFYTSYTDATTDIVLFDTYENYSREDYFKQPMAASSPVIVGPYQYEGATIISYCTPLIYKGETLGVVIVDFKTTVFAKTDMIDPEYPSMYATIYDDKQTIIYDTESLDDIGHTMSEFMYYTSELDEVTTLMSKGTSFSVHTTREDGRKVVRFFTPLTIANTTWWSLTALDESEMNQVATCVLIFLIIASIIMLALILFVLITSLSVMLKPLKPVVVAAQEISKGNFDIQLNRTQGDEIGELCRAFTTMSTSLKDIVIDIAYITEEMANGNFQVHTKDEGQYIGTYSKILMAIRNLRHTLSRTMYQINLAAEQVDSGSEHVAAGAQALSQGSTEQASSIDELAATITEIAHHIQTSGEYAATASHKANDAGRLTGECNEQMKDMVAAMNDINNASQEIGKIIKTIEDIAFQTNILALNAAVEAARAGSAGKGFAVVADEVRNLAGKSAEASKNTSTLIAASMHAVDRGVKLVHDTAQHLQSVSDNAQTIAEMVEKIAATAQEQSESIQQVTVGIDQISAVVQSNSATSEESAAASEELSSQAQMLKELVNEFRLSDTALSSIHYQENTPEPTPYAHTSASAFSGMGSKY